MRALRVGTGSEYRLFQDEQRIGWVDSTSVSFRGFATRDEAAEEAERPLATLLPPTPEESTAGDRGFQIALPPNERMEVFALARARIMWRALQGTGIHRRMRRFAEGPAPVLIISGH